MENNNEISSEPFFKFELYWDELNHRIQVKRCNNNELIKNMINDPNMKYIHDKYINYNDMVNITMLSDMIDRQNPNIDTKLKNSFIENIESLIWNIPITNFKPDDIIPKQSEFEISNITSTTIVSNKNL